MRQNHITYTARGASWTSAPTKMEETNQVPPPEGPQVATCPVSQCYLTVDIVLRSSDNELIGAHKSNLAQFSEGFPNPLDVMDSEEPVYLTEDAGTLKLLMHFMHVERHPSLLNGDLYKSDTIFRLSDAAEKYMVYSAMAVCNVRIADREMLRNHARRALLYAIKYDYPEIKNLAALMSLYGPVQEFVNELTQVGGDRLAVAWFKYRDRYIDIYDAVQRSREVEAEDSSCLKRWNSFHDAVVHELSGPLSDWFLELQTNGQNTLWKVVQKHYSMLLEGCPTTGCLDRLARWLEEDEAMHQSIPDFQTFL